jgi:hypothetical protein
LLRVAFAAEMSEGMLPDAAEERRAFGFKVRFETLREVLKESTSALAFLAPRGAGLTAWSGDARRQAQIRRRFMLMGQTLDSARVWDTRRACQALRLAPDTASSTLKLAGSGSMAVNLVYASLVEPGISKLQLSDLPASHRAGPDYLNVLRVLDVPQAVALAAERSKVLLLSYETITGWEFPAGVASLLGWDKERFGVEQRPSPKSLPVPKPR